MRKINGLLLVVGLIFISACSPKISTTLTKTYDALDYKQEVLVIGLAQVVPENTEVIGQVKIGDTGFSTNCGYDIVIDKAKLEARKAGGNAIKIMEHNPPTVMGSTCHRITANILKIDSIENYTAKVEKEVLLDVDYAIINIYRYSGAGSFVSYDLYLGDSLICRVRNNYKTTIHVKKDGLNSLWAKTEAKSELPINVKMGKTYYLRCGITMGAFVGHPHLQLVDSRTGKSEFESFKAKHQ